MIGFLALDELLIRSRKIERTAVSNDPRHSLLVLHHPSLNTRNLDRLYIHTGTCSDKAGPYSAMALGTSTDFHLKIMSH